MTSSAALPALSCEQLLPLLRTRQSKWGQRYRLQCIGLHSCGETCDYGSTARNEATAASDGDVWVELEPLTPAAPARSPARTDR
jgi:hypothetical protein